MPTLSRTGVEVRDAGRSDLPAVRRVLLGAYQEYAEVLAPAVFGRYLTDILDVQGRTGAGRQLVATDGGRVVGTVTFYADAGQEGFGWPAGWAGLRALGVEPAARGQGIGQALVRACLERARAGGAPVLCLHTAEFMTAAVAMYERLGFRRAPPSTSRPPATWALTASGPCPSWPTGSTFPGPGSRPSTSARCTRTRSPGNAGWSGSRPRRPTGTCWWSTCTCGPAGRSPASTSTPSSPRPSRWSGAGWPCATAAAGSRPTPGSWSRCGPGSAWSS